MMKVLQIAVVTLALSLCSRTAEACDCRPLSWQERIRLSDVVFLARVVQAQPLAYLDVQVLENFKGRTGRRTRIRTGESDCDYFLPPVSIEPGAKFLIYGTVRGGSVIVNRCLGSGPAEGKTDELARLRQAG